MLVLHWALKPQNLSVLFLTGLHAYINIVQDLSPRLERVRKHPMATGEDLWKGELSLSSVKRVKVRSIISLRTAPKLQKRSQLNCYVAVQRPIESLMRS